MLYFLYRCFKCTLALLFENLLHMSCIFGLSIQEDRILLSNFSVWDLLKYQTRKCSKGVQSENEAFIVYIP